MNNNNQNNFFNGFLWGAIIGGGLVFFLSTKKGKNLLKTLSESGLEELSELVEKQFDEEEYFDEEASNGNGIVKQTKEPERKESRPIHKRFFRRKS